MTTSIISIQSQVVFGHVGNSAAVLPMQLRGLDVAAVPTTLLSNHPRYPTVRGQVLDAGLLADLLLGVEERGLVETARFIITGYLGSRENAEVVTRFLERAKQSNPALVYICDPVIGDGESGVFVRAGVAGAIRDNLVPMADILTPNDFEFGYLTGTPIKSIGQFIEARDKAWAGRQLKIVVTGCVLDDTPAQTLENIVLDGPDVTRIATPRIETKSVGTGDLFTGVLTANLASGANFSAAAQLASDTVTLVLRETAAAGEPHMQLGSSIGALLSAIPRAEG